MEATIGPILSKVDNVLNRIDEMKKTKRKTQEVEASQVKKVMQMSDFHLSRSKKFEFCHTRS